MKLATRILPRRDGTVRVCGAGELVFVFQADAQGDLVCEVDDERLASALLATGNFTACADAPAVPTATRRRGGTRATERVALEADPQERDGDPLE